MRKGKSRPGRTAEEETRAIAGMTFDAVPVDWSAFTAENMAERSAQEGVLNRLLQVVMSKDHVALTEMVADTCREPHLVGEPDGFDTIAKMIDTFAEHATFLREGAAAFDGAKARLAVALHRAALQLDGEDAS